jgi:RHS repeat-associated protein
VNAANGAVAGRWEYDLFLGVIRATGPLAFLNPFLGSTKFYDWETGFYYYGYRYYDPSTGRWPNRDPINELGFNLLIRSQNPFNWDEEKNLYGFVGNDSVNRIDPYGLKDRWPPFNGRVHVSKCCNESIRSIDLDNRTVYTTTSGGSTPWNADVDFVLCKGTWYKIGADFYYIGGTKNHGSVKHCDCPSGFRAATAQELQAIANAGG